MFEGRSAGSLSRPSSNQLVSDLMCAVCVRDSSLRTRPEVGEAHWFLLTERIVMTVSLNAPSGSTISLDLEKLFGERVELEAFQFVFPPIDFRLVRGDKPLQEWQKGNSEIYDLQHCPGVKNWARDAQGSLPQDSGT